MRRKTIDDWELGTFFGGHVVRGYVAGRRRIFVWRWWARGRFGVTLGDGLGTDEVLVAMRPSPRVFEGLTV